MGKQDLEKLRLEIKNSNFDLEGLSLKVKVMLEQSPEKLMNVLYLLDVSENKVALVMKEKDLVKKSHELAKLIIEREIQKSKSRN